MSEDFDIYADLEQNDREVEKDNKELAALKMRINELQKQVEDAEQQKTDIIRKNEILLENVSSLLLTAKAEIKRKDTMISDLRKQCDNVVFRRKGHVNQCVNNRTRFTQTSLKHTLNIGVQTLPVGCNDPLCNKSKHTESSQNRDRNRERERVSKSQMVQERELNQGRDRSANREIERYRDQERNRDRDQERNRDRDRYRDNDRERDREKRGERDREKYSERYRKRSQERTRYKEQHSYERSSDKETHGYFTRNKDQKQNEVHTRHEERSYEERQAPVHSRVNEVNEHNKNNAKFPDAKGTFLETRSESSKASHSRTQEFKGSKNPNTVMNTDLNHVSYRKSQKNIASNTREFVSDTMERSAISEYNPVVKETFQSAKLVDANNERVEIEMSSKLENQTVVDTCDSVDNEAMCGSSKTSKKDQQNVESGAAAMKEIEKDSSEGDKNDTLQLQDNHEEASVNRQQVGTSHSTESPKFPKNSILNASCNDNGSISEDDRLSTNGRKVDILESTESINGILSTEKENDETNSNEEHDTLPSAAISNPPVMLKESSSSAVAFSSEDLRSIPVDIIRSDDKTGGSKDINSSVEIKHVQTSLKSKSKPKPTVEVLRNDVTKKLIQNELCQITSSNEPLITSIQNIENEGQNADVCKLNTCPAANNHISNDDANQTDKTQALPCLETTINVEAPHNEIGNEPDHTLMLGNMGSSNELPLVNDAVDELSHKNNLSVTTVADIDTLNEKPRNPPAAVSLADNALHSFGLRDRRSNSCYSDVLESERPPETMSIQTYFMNFNVLEVANEVIVGNEQCLPCVEPVSESELVPLNEATALVAVKETNEVQKNPKTSTAEIVRERLRKKSSAILQKASNRSSTISMPAIPLKRRLSIDSASIACKKYKLNTVAQVDGKKLCVSPSGKLSSTYFSQIDLPITSALDSIPAKLRSPNFKQESHGMLNTPMVVVHSPAKPSHEPNENVQNNYYLLPLGDQSSLQNIMDSLLQTPIKNELTDNVSPPCENGASEEGKGQSLASKNYENVEICSTPVSTKPLSRLSQDAAAANPLWRMPSISITEQKRTIGEPKDSLIPSDLDTDREGSIIDKTEKAVHKASSEHTTHLLGKHDADKLPANHAGKQKILQSPKQILRIPSATQDSSCLNVNNNYETSSTKEKIKKTNVVPVAGISLENDTASVQQPSKTSNLTDVSINVPQSTVFKTPVIISKSTHTKSRTTANSRKTNEIMKVKDQNSKSVEIIPSKKARQKPTVNVDAGKITVTQSSAIPSTSSSGNKIISEPSTKRQPTASQIQRLRQQKNDDEKRTDVSGVQRKVAKDKAPVISVTENTLPVAECSYTEVGKINPQDAQSTVIVNSVQRLNQQTQPEPSVPVSMLSTTNTCDKKIVEAERSQRVISNVTLNLSLADSETNSPSIRKRDTPVRHVREMRIVKESPSLMRVFITRK
ncbi:uncharacterized protein LOC128712639 [Anopheles marshallii]|uniref:uncharacterized protein LOC128712639 n=1 Tax=Anopheles marshallii TaxID=1521116 RepID=UPI00237A75A7|nr:uncharacterized protein LOC128712639 [Anopheles marshallii]